MLRRLSFASIVLLLVGCTNLIKVRSSSVAAVDYEQLWEVAMDVVTSYMHIKEADQAKGRIIATLESKWERSEAEVIFIQQSEGYDVRVKVYREKFQQYVTPEGIGTLQRWVRVGRDKAMERKLAMDIRQRLMMRRN